MLLLLLLLLTQLQPLVANASNPVYATVIKKKTSIVVVNEERTETPPPEIVPFDDTFPDLTSHDANNEQSLVEENKKKLEVIPFDDMTLPNLSLKL